MIRRVCMLNTVGLERFEAYLAALRAGSGAAAPHELLDDPETSLDVEPEVLIDPDRKLGSRLETAIYLDSVLASLGRARIDHNAGLWSWLSLLYFDQLC